ncbi:hypothetical protein BX666DRAFT_1936981 [Dichotomocladium elegans]|nr:hypothetical protein BX666DRAFT_1936981 [Dichotomocladium elegans]
MGLLPHLCIAVGSCIVPTTRRVVTNGAIDATLTVELTAPVPNAEWTDEENRKKVPLHVVICSLEHQQHQHHHHHPVLLDYWFVGHFAFQSAVISRHPQRISIGVDPSLFASTDSDSRALALSPGEAKNTQTVDSHLYPATYSDGRKTDPAGMPSSITRLQIHRDESTEDETMAGQPNSTRYDERVHSAATEVMTQLPSQNISNEADYSEYPGTNMIAATSLAPGCNPAILAGVNLYPSTGNVFGSGEHQSVLASSSPLYSYVVPASSTLPSAADGLTMRCAIETATAGEGEGEEGERKQSMDSAYSPFNYSDYNRLPYRANLRFENDLNIMTQNWTSFEIQQRRRFAPVHQDEQPDQATMTVVSCIYWPEAEDYFITSVDCIYLLENLLGAYFTTEEKNRVRRNFEAFRPQTISRLRPESAAFFRLVMDFPPPKPRTIEKDLKVFPWSCLANALQKVVAKYQPSYSSTASINLSGLAATSPVTNPPHPQSFD